MSYSVDYPSNITTLAEKWWAVRQGPGSLTQVYYTEDSKESTHEKHIDKVLRGGTAINVADGKQAMIEGMQSGYNKGMLGLEDDSSDEDKPEMALSSGIGSGLKPAGFAQLNPDSLAGPSISIAGPSLAIAASCPQRGRTTYNATLTPKQKKEAAKQEKALAKLAAKEAAKKAAEEAEAKATADAAQQKKMAAVYPPGLFRIYVVVALGPRNRSSCRGDNTVTCTTDHRLRPHANLSSLLIDRHALLRAICSRTILRHISLHTIDAQ